MSPSKITPEQRLAAAKHHRIVDGLRNTSTLSNKFIQQVVEEVLSFTPSSYNTQPLRIVLVTGTKKTQLWETIAATAEPILKGAGDESLEQDECVDVIAESGKAHASAAHMFDEFSQHAIGMA